MRVPESVLLGLALVGGSPAAALAMWGFRRRHKTSKPDFLRWFWMIVIVQVALLLVAAFLYIRSSAG